MRNVIAGLLLLIVASLAQGPAPNPAFTWDWRDAQELMSAGQTLATSKDISASERTKLLDSLAEEFKGYSEPTKRA